MIGLLLVFGVAYLYLMYKAVTKDKKLEGPKGYEP